MTLAIDLYGAALAGGSVRALTEDGDVVPLALERWLGRCSSADEQVLARAVGPVLDLGCGPGRHLVSLARRGVLAVGVDLSPFAVAIARRRGAAAIEGSIFGQLPGAGCWGSALLLDGNLGIGGRPAALLGRVADLLAPGGLALVETEPAGFGGRRLRLCLESAGRRSGSFPWALVGEDEIAGLAASSGFSVGERWRAGGRSFAALCR